jgi:hypothetical protein
MVALLAASCGSEALACAVDADASGRWYWQERRGRPYDTLATVALSFDCETTLAAQRGALRAKATTRLAQHGSAHSRASVQELSWSLTRPFLDLRVGVDQVFWGVTEFAHLVDVVNQSDVVEDPFGETKLGQPMLRAEVPLPLGTFTALVTPYFMERRFPDGGEPLRAAPPLGLGPARFEARNARMHLDWALRYALQRGPLDLGVSHFRGTSRDPRFVVTLDPRLGPQAFAAYDLIEQTGLDAQLTLNAWAFKLELASRVASRRTNAYAVGIERTISGVAGTPADLIIALEYVRDQRTPTAVPGFLDDDVSLGVRVALNDVRSTDGKLGVIVDRARHSEAWAAELGSRIAQQWRISAAARVFRHVSARDPLRLLDSDSYLELALTHYF